MMKVFDAALQAIQTHRVHRAMNLDTRRGEYRCAGCDWTATKAGSDDIHLAEMIDKAVD